MTHHRTDLRILLDRVLDLTVQHPSVRDDDYRVEEDRAVFFKPDQLMGQPGDGVRLAAAGRVLDQILEPDSSAGRIRQQAAHHVELVIARPYLLALLAAGLVVSFFDDLGVVLDDAGQPVAGQHFIPQVVGLESVGVRRIAGAVVPSPVEGQKPRALALKMGAEPHLVVVDGEMRQAASKLEELFARVAVALVLLDGVFHRLLGEAVLELERGDRQPVDEQTEVERKLGLVAAIAELARDREAVLRVAGLGPLVPRRRRAVKQVDMARSVPDAIAQHVDRAAPADLALYSGQEPSPRRAVPAKVQRRGNDGLGCTEEGGKLGQVQAVLAVVVPRVAAGPAHAVAGRPLARRVRRAARLPGQGLADEALKPLSLVSVVTLSITWVQDRDFPELSRLYFLDGSSGFLSWVLNSGPCRG